MVKGKWYIYICKKDMYWRVPTKSMELEKVLYLAARYQMPNRFAESLQVSPKAVITVSQFWEN